MFNVIRIQSEDFDLAAELARLRAAAPGAGALVSFVGLVRDLSEDTVVSELHLEHYPGMTEQALTAIVDEAKARWPLLEVLLIHRVGALAPRDQIVLVAVTAAHRREAFAACEFIIDYLKTRAPFWKREATAAGARWVGARAADAAAAARWKK